MRPDTLHPRSGRPANAAAPRRQQGRAAVIVALLVAAATAAVLGGMHWWNAQRPPAPPVARQADWVADPQRAQSLRERAGFWPADAAVPALGWRVDLTDQVWTRRFAIDYHTSDPGVAQLPFSVVVATDVLDRSQRPPCDREAITWLIRTGAPMEGRRASCRTAVVDATLLQAWPSPALRGELLRPGPPPDQQALPFAQRTVTFRGEYRLRPDAVGILRFAGWVCTDGQPQRVGGVASDRTTITVPQTGCFREAGWLDRLAPDHVGLVTVPVRLACAPVVDCVAYTLHAGRPLRLHFGTMPPDEAAQALEPVLLQALDTLHRLTTPDPIAAARAARSLVDLERATCEQGAGEAGRWPLEGSEVTRQPRLAHELSGYGAACLQAAMRAARLIALEPDVGTVSTLVQALDAALAARAAMHQSYFAEARALALARMQAAERIGQGRTLQQVEALRALALDYTVYPVTPQDRAERAELLQRAIALAMELLPASLGALDGLLARESHPFPEPTAEELAAIDARQRSRAPLLAAHPVAGPAAQLVLWLHVANRHYRNRQMDALRESAAKLHDALTALPPGALTRLRDEGLGDTVPMAAFRDVLYTRMLAFADRHFDAAHARATLTYERMRTELGESDLVVRAARLHLDEIARRQPMQPFRAGGDLLRPY
jgi:hypothetical protein